MEEAQSLIERVKIDLQNGKSDEEIFQTTLLLFGRDPETDRQVAELLAAIPQVKIARVLHRMLQVSKEKKVRKIIKRSLYRLKSRGIVAEEVLPDKGKSVLRQLKTEPPKGFGNGIDFVGNRALLLTIPHHGRGLTVIHGLISDTEGLLDIVGSEISRKEFRNFFEEVQETSQRTIATPMIEMEASYVGFLLTEAYQLTLEKGATPPQGYLQLKGEVEKIKKDYERPLIYSLFQVDEIVRDERILERGGELLNADVISSWRIEEDQIRPYADEVWEAEESKIVLTQTQKEARFQGIYQRALTELFTTERRFLYQRRLEEMAYIFFKMGKEEEARISLAVAIDLEKPVNPIQPNPFLFQLVIKSIFTLLKEAYEKKMKEPSLIVKP